MVVEMGGLSGALTTGPFPLTGSRSLWMATKAMVIRTEQAISVRAQRLERLAGEKMRRSESMASLHYEHLGENRGVRSGQCMFGRPVHRRQD